MKLRKGQIIRFISMDEFTGEQIELSGKIIGDCRKIKEGYPEEMAGVNRESEVFLVDAAHYAERFIVFKEEIRKLLGKEKSEWEEKQRQLIKSGKMDFEHKPI